MTACSDGPDNSVIRMRRYDPEVIATMFARVDMTWPKDAQAEFTVASLGELSIIRSSHQTRNSTSRRLERHLATARRQSHFACMPVRGAMRVRHLGRSCELKQDQICLLSSDAEYEIGMSDELEAVWLRIPSKSIEAHTVCLTEALGRPLDAQKGIGRAARVLMCEVAAEKERLNLSGSRILGQSLLSFIGELANSVAFEGQSLPNPGRRKLLARAKDFIEDHLYDEELSPQTIAQGVGVSARYLSEVFADEGLSPMRWVQRRRLEICRQALEKNDKRQALISEIAYSAGFNNVSSFNRLFKSHYGMSPRAYLNAQ